MNLFSSRSFSLAFVLGTAALVGCAASSESTGSKTSSVTSPGDDGASANGSNDGTGTSGSSDGTSAANNASAETCTATFRWLQKDAYKNTPGRTDSAWPPHTTTAVDVNCVDGDGNVTFTKSAYRENHGTTPGTTDANGTPMLDEMKRAQTVAPRATLEAFLVNYGQCECAPQTDFLSLDSVEGATEQKVLSGVTDYISQHLECDGDTTTDALVQMIQSGDYDDALAALPSCTWDDGYGWKDAFTQAAQSVVSDLSAYHVCNNDAKLEAGLWETLSTTGNVGTCDNTSSVCQGPLWFYTP